MIVIEIGDIVDHKIAQDWHRILMRRKADLAR
jgi:hypothetical protein